MMLPHTPKSVKPAQTPIATSTKRNGEAHGTLMFITSLISLVAMSTSQRCNYERRDPRHCGFRRFL